MKIIRTNFVCFTSSTPETIVMNSDSFKLGFAERDKKQTMIDLRGISTNWLKNQLCPSTRLSRLRHCAMEKCAPSS
jgi:hypothetical protein